MGTYPSNPEESGWKSDLGPEEGRVQGASVGPGEEAGQSGGWQGPGLGGTASVKPGLLNRGGLGSVAASSHTGKKQAGSG